MNPPTILHLEAWFSGHVQGVGFRYSTLNVAKGYEVTGEVKNLPDGRVFLAAEGHENEVRKFLEDLKDYMASYIKNVEVHETPTGCPSYNDFTITH